MLKFYEDVGKSYLLQFHRQIKLKNNHKLWTWKNIKNTWNNILSECKEIIPKEKIPHKKQGWKKPELV